MARQRPLWDLIVKTWQLSAVTKRQQSRITAIYADLKALGATCEDLPVRRAKMLAVWGRKSDTPESLAKHWSMFAGTDKTVQPGQPSEKERLAMEAEWAEQRKRVEREQR